MYQNNKYHTCNYSKDLKQIVINQEKVEALFWLLQPDRRTSGSSLEPCNQNVMLVHVWMTRVYLTNSGSFLNTTFNAYVEGGKPLKPLGTWKQAMNLNTSK